MTLRMTIQIANRPYLWPYHIHLWMSVFVIASLVVIFVLQYLEHGRSQSTNYVVVLYWPLILLAFAMKLRSMISRRVFEDDLLYFITHCLGFGLTCVEFGLVWLVQKTRGYDALADDDIENECPSERASIFSLLTFNWMTPMMKFGYRQYITSSDLCELRNCDTAQAAQSTFQNAWSSELVNKKIPSLWMALIHGFGAAYFRALSFKCGADVFAYLQPQLLRLLIAHVDSYRGREPRPVTNGIAIAMGMLAVSIAQSLCLHQCFQHISRVGIRLKSSVVSAIYTKSLVLSNGARAAKTTGDIVNLMAVDSQRLQDATQVGQHIWSAPLQIIFCLASLYQLVGYSMVAGVTTMVIMVPANGYLASVLRNLQKQQMKAKDAKSSLLAEILNHMKSIKLFAWDPAFLNRIRNIRTDRELATLRKIGAFRAVSSFIGAISPFLVACSTFATYALVQQRPLTTEVVFPALTLFHLLASPLTVLPAAVSTFAEASIAMRRLQDFFTADELQPEAAIRREAAAELGQESVLLRDATFKWDGRESRIALENINFSAWAGELCCLVGRVGAGKSSLIQAILGDLYKANGTVTTFGLIAYVTAQPWVLNASVRENITFGHRWDPKFYAETVKSCALARDIAQLPNGDETQVGNRGISLSGGQKARLCLARAVYSRADVYLIDDCLSAVDQHVGRHLIDNVLGPRGLLKQKTRILATNSLPAMMEADMIVLIRGGKISEKGSYSQLSAIERGEFASVINRVSKSNHSDSDNRSSKVVSIASNGSHPTNQDHQPHRRVSVARSPDSSKKVQDVEAVRPQTTSQKELLRQGSVSWSVYGGYAKASNLVAVVVYLTSVLCMQFAELGEL